jgi:hypothetical protein
LKKQEKTYRLALCAMLAALGVVLLCLGSVIEVIDISMAVIASFFAIYAVIEFGGVWPWLIYAVTGLLSLILMPSASAAYFYLLFFGFYPILKEKLERLPRVLSWVLKEAVFHASLLLTFLCLRFVLALPELTGIGSILLFGMLLACEVVFVLYDVALTRLISFYLIKLRYRLRRK